jgi:hypothetical protein
MIGRPGSLLSIGNGEAERDLGGGAGSVSPGARVAALVEAELGSQVGPGDVPGFDPTWGTLRPPLLLESDPWLTRPGAGGAAIEVACTDAEIFCDGFQVSGQLETGQFGRLSDWLKMQTGFIAVLNASINRLGGADLADLHEGGNTQWVRLDGIAILAERAQTEHGRPGAPVVPKQAHGVSMVMPAYRLEGSMHIHADGSVSEFLASPETRFLPITDVLVRLLSDPTVVARFPFALVNRDHLVSLVNGH